MMIRLHERWSAAPLALALSFGPAWGQTPPADRYGYGPGMMGWGAGYDMFFGPFVMIVMLAVVVAAIVIVLQVGGRYWPGGSPLVSTPQGRAPLDILRERFARGEIDKAEYEDRRGVLGD